MATKTKKIKNFTFQSPDIGERFDMEIDGDEVTLFWVTWLDASTPRFKAIFAETPKSEVILLLKGMIEKLEGGES